MNLDDSDSLETDEELKEEKSSLNITKQAFSQSSSNNPSSNCSDEMQDNVDLKNSLASFYKQRTLNSFNQMQKQRTDKMSSTINKVAENLKKTSQRTLEQQ